MKTKDLDKKPSARDLDKNPSGRDLPSALSHQSRLQSSKSPLVKPTAKDTTRTIPEASAAAEVDRKKSSSLRRGSPGKSQDPGSAAAGSQSLLKKGESKKELDTKG